MLNDAAKKMMEFDRRTQQALHKIADVARPLIATLKDANREHAAEGLSAAFFELDVVMEETRAFLTEDPRRLLDLLRGGGGAPR
jgi:replicative DNA helicase